MSIVNNLQFTIFIDLLYCVATGRWLLPNELIQKNHPYKVYSKAGTSPASEGAPVKLTMKDNGMNFTFQDNLSVQVAKWLAEKIIRADYAAGSRIMEEKIAEELGISRGPIREALLILQKQRLVKILPRRGAIVKEMTATEIKDLYAVIAALYTLLGQGVARQWQDDQLAPMSAQLKLMQAHAKQGDYSIYFEQTIVFIRLSFSIANNHLLEELIEDLIPSLYRVQYRSIQQRKINLKDHWKNYAGILQALQERDVKKIAVIIASFSQQEQQYALETY